MKWMLNSIKDSEQQVLVLKEALPLPISFDPSFNLVRVVLHMTTEFTMNSYLAT